MAKLSLQEQMLKAGLVNQKKLKKAKKGSKKSRELAKEVKAGVQASKQEQSEKAKALNKAQQEALHNKEIKAQIKQLINMNKIELGKGDIKYNFTHDGVIKYVYVKPDTREQLIAGILAIALVDNEYCVIPTSVANKIKQRDESAIIDVKESSEDTVDEDDPYADFVVPDDLMW